MLDYSIAYARTVAGVHYASDNIAGLMVGQEILAQKLPGYLNNEYGADFTLVKRAVEAAKYDWTKFESDDCWNSEKFQQFITVAKGEDVLIDESADSGGTNDHSMKKTPKSDRKKSKKTPKSDKKKSHASSKTEL